MVLFKHGALKQNGLVDALFFEEKRLPKWVSKWVSLGHLRRDLEVARFDPCLVILLELHYPVDWDSFANAPFPFPTAGDCLHRNPQQWKYLLFLFLRIASPLKNWWRSVQQIRLLEGLWFRLPQYWHPESHFPPDLVVHKLEPVGRQ